MGLIDRVAASMGFERRAAPDPSWAALAPGIGYHAGVSARFAENNATVLACVNLIGESMGSLPVIVYRREGDARVEVPGHPLAALVRTGANPSMTWPDTISHVVASALLTGNGLMEIVRGSDGQLASLAYIPWGNVTVAELSSGRLAYDVSDGRGNTRRLLASEVIHLRDRTDDGKIGRSRLSRAADAFEAVNLANHHARTFLANGASPSGVIEADSMIGDPTLRRIRDAFQERHSGVANAGRTMVLDGGLKYRALQVSPEDAELLETRKFGDVEICRVYGVPPPLVQDYSHNTFTNSESAGRWFAMFCLSSWARKIEAEFARTLFPGGAYEVELDLSGFLRGDPTTRWNAHKIAVETGVLDPDEVRQIEGWNAREKGPAI